MKPLHKETSPDSVRKYPGRSYRCIGGVGTEPLRYDAPTPEPVTIKHIRATMSRGFYDLPRLNGIRTRIFTL